MNKLLELENDKNILEALSTTTCLLTLARSSDISDIDSLVDFVDGVKVNTKHLVIFASRMQEAEFTLLLNKTINFDVRFVVKDAGKFALQPADIGWPTRNAKKLSNSQACCLAQLCLAAA